MEKLSDSIERKFVDVIDIDDYEVLTDDGWHDIKSVNKTIEYKIYELKTKNFSLKCADTHIVFDQDMNEIFVKDLRPGQSIMTEIGLDEVVSVIDLNESDNMYDLSLGDESQHRFFTNGILSHNSTLYCIYSLWLCMFHPEKKVMILANKSQTALELVSRVITAYQYIPSFIKPGCVTINKGEIAFSNMSSIRGFASSSDAARGHSANCVICDEFAFLQPRLADQLFTSMFPVISSSKNGKFFLVSTPNGTDNLYYDIWQQANQKNVDKNLDGWQPFSMYWWQVPGHDEAWKKRQIAAIGETRFAQEFNNEFLTSATNRKLIPDDVLDRYKTKLQELKIKNPEFYYGKQQKIVSEDQKKVFEFKMWHEFDPKRTYMASADISEGYGGDDSVLYVWDITDLREITMCAMFASNHVSLVEFAYITRRILVLYNDPYLCCERNGVSGGMIDSLRITYGYQNVVAEGKNGEFGVFSHVTTKGKACLWARDMMSTEGFGFNIYDKELFDELTTFCKKDTKGVHLVYTALPGQHDDHVMAFIWGCYMLMNEIIEKYYIVCTTFTSTLGNIYAQLIQPQVTYSAHDIRRIVDDPMHQEFLDFRSELEKKLHIALSLEENDAEKYLYQNNMDPYFGDREIGGSWNYTSNGPKHDNLSPTSYVPSFFIT